MMENLRPFFAWILKRERRAAVRCFLLPLFLFPSVLVFGHLGRGDPTLEAWAIILGLGAGLWYLVGIPIFANQALSHAHLLSTLLKRKLSALYAVYTAAAWLAAYALSVFPSSLEYLYAFLVVNALMTIPLMIVATAGFISSLFSLGDPLSKVSDCLGRGDHEEALKYIELATQRGEEERAALLHLALTLTRGGLPKFALQVVDAVLAAAPEEVNGWRAKADLAYMAGQNAESDEAFKRALKLDPKNGDIYYDRAVKRARDPDTYDQALSDYNRAISLNAANSRYLANRAALCYQMKRYESALSDAEKAFQLDPADRVAIQAGYLSAQELGRAPEEEKWARRMGIPGAGSPGLTRASSSGPGAVVVQGTAEPLLELHHGGYTDQYIEFSPDAERIASWKPGRVEVFRLSDGASEGLLEGEHGLLGFSRDGSALLTIDNGQVRRRLLPTLEIVDEDGPGTDWRPLGKSSAYSTRTGTVVSLTFPDRTIQFPYHRRVSPSQPLMCCPGAHRAVLTDLDGEPAWQSEPVGRDVSALGFSPGGEHLAFGTMGGSLYLVEMERREVTQRCPADGEIRSLAVSADGLVAVGCADLSSKVWLFDLKSGRPAHVLDCRQDAWSVAFSDDGQLLATGHEDGIIRVWKRKALPTPA